MDDDTAPDPWTEVEDLVAEIGLLAGAAECYHAIRSGEGPALLNRGLTLAAAARDLYRQRPSDIAATASLTPALRQVADRYRSLLQMARGATAYRRAVAAWQAGDASGLRDAIPAVFADVDLTTTPPPWLYYPVAIMRRNRMAPIQELADEITTLAVHGIPAGEPGNAPATDDALRAVVVYDTWPAIDTPVALRLDGTTIALPLFRVATSGELLIYAERILASSRILLAASPDADCWPDMGIDYEAFRTALAAALTQRGCTPIRYDS